MLEPQLPGSMTPSASWSWSRYSVFVASDDGLLYCLDAADGRLQWKFRGGPRNELVLGNERAISRWPARGGPAVAASFADDGPSRHEWALAMLKAGLQVDLEIVLFSLLKSTLSFGYSRMLTPALAGNQFMVSLKL
mgnify:CR=1 FL=1